MRFKVPFHEPELMLMEDVPRVALHPPTPHGPVGDPEPWADHKLWI